MLHHPCVRAAFLGLLVSVLPLSAGIVINEVMYHPVETPAFDTNGLPLLDLTDDVHEFIELHNPDAAAVSLAGWRLGGGVTYDFPASAVVPARGFLVIARNPERLTSVYGLPAGSVQGPYTGNLGNQSDTVRLRNPADQVVDSVSYSSESPWAIGADALGAEDEWTGLRSQDYQYRGRSLERVSVTHPANDAANWLASALAAGPTPGRSNTVRLVVPRPVVAQITVSQAVDGEPTIRAGQAVRLGVVFTATNGLSSPQVEYFLDDINSTAEVRQTVALARVAGTAPTVFTATVPGQVARSIVRYRIRANRGGGTETVSPRADDPFAWHAWFVTPARSSSNRVYDCFISAVSLNTLATNIGPTSPWNNRRIVQPNPPGFPRASWNATEPAVMVHNGRVYDIRMRHHGSQYHRDPSRGSYKWQFPRYARFEDREGMYITDKDETTVSATRLMLLAGIPTAYVQWVDFYMNGNGFLLRLQQDETDDRLFEKFARDQALAAPGTPVEPAGEFYKAQGCFDFENPLGPYGPGSFRRLDPVLPWWTERARYDATYSLQMHLWKGINPLMQLLQGLWAARGDTAAAPNPNVNSLRAFLGANFDVDQVLTYMAMRSWMGVWDDFNHNHFEWRRANGRWGMMPWDFDAEFGGIGMAPTASIYLGEFGVPTGYHLNTWVDANWIKDSFYKAYRAEYRQRLFELNNTLLHPTNITAIGLASVRTWADERFASVNTQVGLGTYYRPLAPTNVAPAGGSSTFPPASLVCSPYRTTNPAVPAHRSTTWLIRSATGSYTAPIIRTTSTTNLTRLPIPFDQLTFGETYFWKCFQTDATGHPSQDSVESSFVYGATPVSVNLVRLDATTRWKFAQGVTNLPANWPSAAYNDAAWGEGPALLGVEPAALPEPIRTPLVLSNSYITYYFRTRFVFDGPTAGVTLRLRQVVDDGVVFYLNGVELSRTRISAGTPTPGTLANASVGDARYEGPFTVPSTALVSGTNILAAEVHQGAIGSSDLIFGAVLDATVPASPGVVQISEILADNRGVVTNGTDSPDYIELRNTSGVPQDLGQMSLSDDVTRPGRFTFPAGTILPPNGFLTVWCDDNTNAPGLHTGFGLDNDGQTVALFVGTPGGIQLADSVAFGLQIPNHSLSRLAPTGQGAPASWVLSVPTAGGTNVPATVAPATVLRINEWMASSTAGPDWLELHNPAALPVALGGLFLADSALDPTNSAIAANSFIAAGGFEVFIADQDPGQGARHVDFKLSSGGESILLSTAAGALVDQVDFGPQATDVSAGRMPDGGATLVSFPDSESPGAPNFRRLTSVVINEVLSHTVLPEVDRIELRNVSDVPVDVSGWWLSDRAGDLLRVRLPALAPIPPGGFIVMDESVFNAPGDPMAFALDGAHGDEVFLSAAAGGVATGFRTSQRFGAADPAVSFGRVPTTQGVDFWAQRSTSFGTDNPGPRVGPVVISEVEYRPPDLPGDDDDYEFVELQNISGAPVPLFDPGAPTNSWRLRDAVDFTFPPGVTLAPGERIVVLRFDPVANTGALARFLAIFAPPPSVRLFGPFSGALDNAGDSVELVKPGTPVAVPGPDFGFVPSILVDRVKYTDHAPWPSAADGFGPSLQRLDLAAHGNEPTNWFASGVTPGGANIPNVPPTVAISAPAGGAGLPYGHPVEITAAVADSDGRVTLVEFIADGVVIDQVLTPPFRTSWSNVGVGFHTLQARAVDNSLGRAVSAPVTFEVINQPPTVTLTSPSDGVVLKAPTNVVLTATAADPDGSVARVEFYDNNVRLGDDSTSPYSMVWTNLRSGSHELVARAVDNVGAIVSSVPVRVTVVQDAYIAYVVPAGAVGSQTYANGLGMDFDVLTNIVVTRLGVFDSGANGLGLGPLTVQLYSRNGNAGVLRSTLTMSNTDAGTLIGGSRFKALPTPVTLTPGSYSVVSYGHSAANPAADTTIGDARSWFTDGAGGAIRFVGSSRFGGTPGTFPSSVDAASADGYASATFEYLPEPKAPVLVISPASIGVPKGSNVTFACLAVGSGTLTYRWLHDGVPVPGAGSTSLLVSSVQADQTGVYQVVVSNTFGAVTSAPAILSLLVEPLITQPPLSQVVPVGGTVTLSVSVTNTATLPVGYRWRRGTANVPGGTFLLHQHTSFLVLTNVQQPLTNYSVVVTNLARPNGIISPTAVLTLQVDSDGDGMSDAWELAHSLDPGWAGDRDQDLDLDGVSNGREFEAGTSPDDRNSFLRVDLALGPDGATLTFGAVSNHTYSIRYQDGLGGEAWQRLGDFVARSTNRVERITDPAPVSGRFYQVVSPRIP